MNDFMKGFASSFSSGTFFRNGANIEAIVEGKDFSVDKLPKGLEYDFSTLWVIKWTDNSYRVVVKVKGWDSNPIISESSPQSYEDEIKALKEQVWELKKALSIIKIMASDY